ncbi:MAG TPA: hypothetical protein VK158_03240 [Acidobacteriota bacterium]|nr:hypothetical protein [Acidobacteriota bacterium]
MSQQFIWIIALSLAFLIGCTASQPIPVDETLRTTEVVVEGALNQPSSFTHLSEFEELTDPNAPYTLITLQPKEPYVHEATDMKLRLELVDYRRDDPTYEHKLYNKYRTESWPVHTWVKLKVNGKTDIFPDEEMVKVTFEDGEILYIALSFMSENTAQIFVAETIR